MIRTAQVVAVHPERRTVDLVFMATGLRAAEVDVLSSAVSSDSGLWDVPSVPKPVSEAAAGGLHGSGRNLIAAVEDTDMGRPVVVGFIHPGGGQMPLSQQDRFLRRQNGAYHTIAPDGSMEFWHPGGGYVRIGAGEHEDLGQYAADGQWQTPKAPAPQITVVTSGFTLVIEPGGKTTLTSSGDASLSWDGTLTVKSGGDMRFEAGGGLAFTAAGETTMSSSGDLTMTAPRIDLNP